MKDPAALASDLDANDPLAAKRGLFALPDNTIYLDGNSLGACSHAVRDRMQMVVQWEWGENLIAGWNDHDWLSLPSRVGDRIGRLLGAGPGQVLCCDSLTVNLFKLLLCALRLRPGRRIIVSEQGNFPTDNYVVEGIRTLLAEEGVELRLLDREQLYNADYSDVAVVSVTHVNFRDGSLHDLPALTQRVQDQGALMLWDLAHSAGVTELSIDAHGVDMAVGCTYKYLNAGPGGPGYLYLAERHHAAAVNPIAGWMGHARVFEFAQDYEPAAGIRRFLTGTPSVLATSAADAALDAFEEVSPAMLRAKSEAQTRFFMSLIATSEVLSSLECLTPLDSACRGSQVCVTHGNGYAVAQALIERGVIVDFREPNIIRFGFAPLYISFSEIAQAAVIFEDILRTGMHKEARFQTRKAVP